jgi:hypothetical protein
MIFVPVPRTTTTKHGQDCRFLARCTVVIEWNHDGKLPQVKDRLHRVIGVCPFFFVDWIVIDVVGCSGVLHCIRSRHGGSMQKPIVVGEIPLRYI